MFLVDWAGARDFLRELAKWEGYASEMGKRIGGMHEKLPLKKPNFEREMHIRFIIILIRECINWFEGNKYSKTLV